MTTQPEYQNPVDYTNALWKGHVQPEEIWHYTSAEAALNILRTGAIWATSIRMLNDSGEFDYGREFLEDRWKEIRGTWEGKDATLIEGLVTEVANGLDDREFFTFSASSTGDSLSQFRAYGPYALRIDEEDAGFQARISNRPIHPKSLETPDKDEIRSFPEWKLVVYDREIATRLADKFFELVQDIGPKLRHAEYGMRQFPAGHEETYSELNFTLKFMYVTLASYLKHPSFKEEREVRLLIDIPFGSDAVNIRTGRYGMTPYAEIELEWPAAKGEIVPLVAAVNIGPNVEDMHSALWGVQAALDKFKMGAIPVLQSGSPLRG